MLPPALAPAGKGVRSDIPPRKIPAQRKGIVKLLWSRSCRAGCCTSWGDISHSHGRSPAQPKACLYLPQLQRVPVVVHKGQDLLEVKVFLLALHTQVVEGEMDDVHPAAKRGTGSAALVPPPCPVLPVPLQPPDPPKPPLEPSHTSQGKQPSPEVNPSRYRSQDSIP